MEVTLSPELESIVKSDLSRGRYASVEAYIAEAVGLLHEREEWFGETLEEERAKLEASWQEAESGELMDEEEVRAEMRAMKAEFIKGKSAA